MSKLGSRINNLRRECVNNYCIDEDLQREFIEIRKEVEEIYKTKVHLPDVIGSWVSVKDRLPEIAGYYIIYESDIVYRAFFSYAGVKTWYDDNNDIKQPTHWMKLPKKPIDA